MNSHQKSDRILEMIRAIDVAYGVPSSVLFHLEEEIIDYVFTVQEEQCQRARKVGFGGD